MTMLLLLTEIELEWFVKTYDRNHAGIKQLMK